MPQRVPSPEAARAQAVDCDRADAQRLAIAPAVAGGDELPSRAWAALVELARLLGRHAAREHISSQEENNGARD